MRAARRGPLREGPARPARLRRAPPRAAGSAEARRARARRCVMDLALTLLSPRRCTTSAGSPWRTATWRGRSCRRGWACCARRTAPRACRSSRPASSRSPACTRRAAAARRAAPTPASCRWRPTLPAGGAPHCLQVAPHTSCRWRHTLSMPRSLTRARLPVLRSSPAHHLPGSLRGGLGLSRLRIRASGGAMAWCVRACCARAAAAIALPSKVCAGRPLPSLLTMHAHPAAHTPGAAASARQVMAPAAHSAKGARGLPGAGRHRWRPGPHVPAVPGGAPGCALPAARAPTVLPEDAGGRAARAGAVPRVPGSTAQRAALGPPCRGGLGGACTSHAQRSLAARARTGVFGAAASGHVPPSALVLGLQQAAPGHPRAPGPRRAPLARRASAAAGRGHGRHQRAAHGDPPLRLPGDPHREPA